MKKVLTIVLALTLALALLAGCTSTPASSAAASGAASGAASDAMATGGVAKEDLLIGVVHILDPADQGYTYNHDLGVRYMLEELGLSEEQYIPKFNVEDSDPAATSDAIQELVEAGCQIIFATSFGYGPTVAEFAAQYPDVQFCHATGTGAHFAGLDNMHNYFARIHEARYLAGVAAGMKALEIGNPQLGYIGAFAFAEVISGLSAFYLGAQSVYPEVTMDVLYIDSWGDTEKETAAAQTLIDRGAGVISQHSDNVAPATVAERNGVFHVGYNNDMTTAAPNASLLSARINWGIYMTYAVQSLIDGTPIDMDWSEGLDTGAAYLSPLNTTIAAEGTQEALDAAAAEIMDGMQIFSGALVDGEGNPAAITNFDGDVIFTFEDESSVFEESVEMSAPAFNVQYLEGITVVE